MKKLATTLGILLASGITYAEWAEVATYQGTREEILSNIYWDLHTRTDPDVNGWPPEVNFPEDPEDSNNHVNWTKPVGTGEHEWAWFETWQIYNLGDNAIAEGDSGTLYYRFYKSGEGHFLNVATLPWEVAPGDPLYWAEAPDLKLADRQDLLFSTYLSGVSSEPSNEGFFLRAYTSEPMPTNTWIEVWQVLHTSTDTFEVYARWDGSDGIKPLEGARVVDGGSIETATEFNMRYTDGLDTGVQSVVLLHTGGNPASPPAWEPVYIDDIYINNTEVAVDAAPNGGGDMWHGYTVGAEGWVDTGNWLGWVWVGHDPWVWSISLNKYVYITDSSELGGWVFIGK